MEFKPFIYNAKQEQIPVSIAPMTDADAQKTISAWQTAWTSDYLSDLRLEKYAAKLDEEELREMERLYRVKAAKKLGLRTQLTYGEKMKAAEDENDFRV